MEELRSGFKDKDRHASIILLTDGEPNVFPPSGYIKEL
jgi:Mg-chelatase subunit ChlD